MGAAKEIKTYGSGDAQIKGVGCWIRMGFRAYADTRLTDARKISRLVARTSLSDSEGDPDAPANMDFAESLRKRLNPFPPEEPDVDPLY